MASKKHRGPTLGSIIHRDSSGRKVGYSERNILGGYVDYDRHGRVVGQSESDGHGGYNHYDRWGKPAGHSEPGEYVHNPQDNLFKTGSYNYKEKRNQSAYSPSSSSYQHNSISSELPQTPPVHKETSPLSQPTNERENHIDNYHKNYKYVKKQFLGFLFASLSLVFIVGACTYLHSDGNITQTVIFSLITAFFACLGLSSSYNDFKTAQRLWKQEKNQNHTARISKEEVKKITPEAQKPPKVVSNSTKTIPQKEATPKVLSDKTKIKRKKSSQAFGTESLSLRNNRFYY